MSDSVASELEQRIVVRERLRLLALGYYVKGGVTVVLAALFLCYCLVFVGLSFVPASEWNKKAHTSSGPVTETTSPFPLPKAKTSEADRMPPPVFFRIFAGVMGVFVSLGLAFGGLTIYAGRCVQKRKHYVFILIMAMLNCLSIPWGTFLGVLSLIVLQSPAAQKDFKTGINVIG